ncbi:hypothetical protein BpHYR1_021969 [Brachionus plicatilis]|uniref:Uncharacterized protein n=1 Tax=Brachionus plicatilis TaxID=10195 RepID=A0A3M7PET5_BRAPC|nr:hypothetical protein BpHYR1_021969 [Brachionus plicatilis]
MKFFILLNIICLIAHSSGLSELKEFGNPLKLFNTCISDHQCEHNEFCDHNGINPIGSCTEGKKLGGSCFFDRYCQSKNCYLMKCVSRKPVLDGPCTEDNHSECLPEQYCSGRDDAYKCRDRKCYGFCGKDAHCLTNNCRFFRCERPSAGCDKEEKN